MHCASIPSRQLGSPPGCLCENVPYGAPFQSTEISGSSPGRSSLDAFGAISVSGKSFCSIIFHTMHSDSWSCLKGPLPRSLKDCWHCEKGARSGPPGPRPSLDGSPHGHNDLPTGRRGSQPQENGGLCGRLSGLHPHLWGRQPHASGHRSAGTRSRSRRPARERLADGGFSGPQRKGPELPRAQVRQGATFNSLEKAPAMERRLL